MTVPHGTPGGYTNHRCRCESCREARHAYYKARGYAERYRRRKGQKPRAEHLAAIEPAHGTESRYTNRGCRCDLCREAARVARAARRRRKVAA